MLHRGDVDDLAALLTLLEDWLLHADLDTLRDLADFYPHRNIRDPARIVIDELGTHTRRLRRLLTTGD